jgi:hypothetical protein
MKFLLVLIILLIFIDYLLLKNDTDHTIIINILYFIVKIILLLSIVILFYQKNKLPVNYEISNTINDGLKKIFNILDTELTNKSLCFIGGAIVLEDPGGKIFNLLTYDDSNIKCTTNNELLSSNVNIIQTLTHSEFTNNNFMPECVPSNPYFTIPNNKCISNKFNCNKFERKIYVDNICKKCILDNENIPKIKQSLLYYPFEDKNKYRFLYIKLESHPSISFGHAKNAIDTYITKTKFKSDSKNCKPRREYIRDKNIWIDIHSKDDHKLYQSLKEKNILNDNDLKLIEYYNKNIRVGNELFLPYSFIIQNQIFDIK